jgi:hypothetical protein
MLDPRPEQITRSPDDSVDGVALFQEQLGQIRTVLAGNAGDERSLIVTHGDKLITGLELEEAMTVP